MLDQVKIILQITHNYQDDVIQGLIDEVMAFLIDGGVPEASITSGLVARGVSDLWNYNSAGGKFSEYFLQRAAQLGG